MLRILTVKINVVLSLPCCFPVRPARSRLPHAFVIYSLKHCINYLVPIMHWKLFRIWSIHMLAVRDGLTNDRSGIIMSLKFESLIEFHQYEGNQKVWFFKEILLLSEGRKSYQRFVWRWFKLVSAEKACGEWLLRTIKV